MVDAQPRSEADTRLRGHWLLLARVGWIVIAALALVLYVASVPTYFAFLHVECTGAFVTCRNNGQITPDDLRAFQALGFSLNFYATYWVALYIVFTVGYAAIGTVIFWRKSDDRMALFASLTLIMFPAGFNSSELATLPSAWSSPAQVVVFLGNSSLFLFFYLALLLVPLSIGVAILRSRLFDIDILINRTLVYGSLTAILGLIYFASVLALQALLSVFTGHFSSGPQTPVVIVASTLGIAALFHPLRRRLQAIIDRVGSTALNMTPPRTLAAFSASLRDEVDLDQLREQLLAVVQETMQPSHISLWLRDTEQSRERNTRLLPRIDEEE